MGPVGTTLTANTGTSIATIAFGGRNRNWNPGDARRRRREAGGRYPRALIHATTFAKAFKVGTGGYDSQFDPHANTQCGAAKLVPVELPDGRTRGRDPNRLLRGVDPVSDVPLTSARDLAARSRRE
ncbi:hypothetical protein NLS1_32050 [Nocardioides sp. LS1]|nr:hypothetical protein NLS1_32050 [Nocardioides sp. LS1]